MKGEFVPFTADLLTKFYGRMPSHTSRGFAYVMDGEPLVLVGVLSDRGVYRLFSEAKPGLRDGQRSVSKRRIIIEGARRTVALIKDMGIQVYACADRSIPGADVLLKHLGFQRPFPDTQPEIFVWRE